MVRISIQRINMNFYRRNKFENKFTFVIRNFFCIQTYFVNYVTVIWGNI